MFVLVAHDLGCKFQFLMMLVDAVSYINVGNHVYVWLLENVEEFLKLIEYAHAH